MPIEIKAPWPPTFHDPAAFYFGMVVGFIVVVISSLLADQLGTYLFHRGYAKPFYIRGRRIHHFWIKLFVPLSYVLFCILLLMGYVLPIWSDLYVRLFSVLVIAGVCMCVDSLADRRWPKIRKDQILHHEWVYALIFLYVIQFVVEVRI